MRRMKNDQPTTPPLRVRAGELLSKNGTRLLLIEAILVLGLLVGLYVTLGSAFEALSYCVVSSYVGSAIVSALYWLALIFVSVFLTAPMVLGVLWLAARLCDGETVRLADMFRYFSSPKLYRQALSATLPLVWTLMAGGALVGLTGSLLSILLPPTFGSSLLSIVLMGLEVLGVGMLILCRYSCLYRAVARKETTDASDHGSFCRGLRFILHFLPWLVLGSLTFGVLLIADTFPRMLLAYCLDCTQGRMAQNCSNGSGHPDTV